MYGVTVSPPTTPPLPSLLTPPPASNVIRVSALVPIHLYGQLALHPEGCAILQHSGHIEEFAGVIRDNIDSCEDVMQVKATVWALVSVCVCVCVCVCVFAYSVIMLEYPHSPIQAHCGTC